MVGSTSGLVLVNTGTNPEMTLAQKLQLDGGVIGVLVARYDYHTLKHYERAHWSNHRNECILILVQIVCKLKVISRRQKSYSKELIEI